MCKQHLVEASQELEKRVVPEIEIQSCEEPFEEVIISKKDTFVCRSSPRSDLRERFCMQFAVQTNNVILYFMIIA